MKHLMIITYAAVLAACSPSTSQHSVHDMKMSETANSVVVSNARVLPPFPGKDTAAAYFELKNEGADNRLLSVSSPISGAVEIHNHIEEDGVMKMRRVDGVALGAGESIAFKPGSYHIMMFKANLPKTQEDVSLTLTYSDGKTVTLIAPVEGRGDDQGEMKDHSGH